MKNTFLTLLLILSALNVHAETGGLISQPLQSQGGFNGPPVAKIDVARAKELRDDTWVVLEGYITHKVGDELYGFKDSSGNVSVDIDDKIWRGLSISPSNLVRIEGEVDKDWNSIEIDVKRISLVK